MQHLLKDSDLSKAQIEALIALGKAVKAYNDTVGSLETRVLPAVRRFDELGVASRKARVDPTPIDVHVRQPGLLEVDLE